MNAYRLKLFFVLIILLFVQGYLFENVLPAILAFCIALYVLYIRSEFKPSVIARRNVDRVLIEGKKAEIKLFVKNLVDKDYIVEVIEELPRGFKWEKPEPFVLGGREEKVVQYYIMPAKGTYKLSGLKLKLSDIRGLYCDVVEVKDEITVEVIPSLDVIREEAKVGENLRLARVYKMALLGLMTTELHSLRRFQIGDDTRYIDWKASARLNELIVKEFLREWEGDFYIVLDASREMRKGIKKAKIDYATTLALQLIYALRDKRVGLIIYDDFGVIEKVVARQNNLESITRVLKISPIASKLLSAKVTAVSFSFSKRSFEFLKRILPTVKGRRSFTTGLLEVINHLPSSAFLIFIADITSHTSELMRVLSNLRENHKILLLTPNPILFYDYSKLSKEELLWWYKRYEEREELVKTFSKIVPTIDLGPSDMLEMIARVVR